MQIFSYFLTETLQDCCQLTHLPSSLPGSPGRPSSHQGSQRFQAPRCRCERLAGTLAAVTAKHSVIRQRAWEQDIRSLGNLGCGLMLKTHSDRVGFGLRILVWLVLGGFFFVGSPHLRFFDEVSKFSFPGILFSVLKIVSASEF